MSVGVRVSCKQDARCCVSTAQHSIDESGQMSWQGDLDIPISYGTFSECSAPRHAPGFLLAPDKKTHKHTHTHTHTHTKPVECTWLIIAAPSSVCILPESKCFIYLFLFSVVVSWAKLFSPGGFEMKVIYIRLDFDGQVRVSLTLRV